MVTEFILTRVYRNLQDYLHGNHKFCLFMGFYEILVTGFSYESLWIFNFLFLW